MEPDAAAPDFSRLRRSSFVVVLLEDYEWVDLAQILRGAIETRKEAGWVAVAPGRRKDDAPASAPTRSQVSERFSTDLAADLRSRTTHRLEPRRLSTPWARDGILISDAADATLGAIRLREEKLESGAWSLEAAWLHYASVRAVRRRRGRSEDEPGALQSTRNRFSLRPRRTGRRRQRISAEPIRMRRSHATMSAPRSSACLHRRQTVRAFDRSVSFPLARISRLLHASFGCHGQTDSRIWCRATQANQPVGRLAASDRGRTSSRTRSRACRRASITTAARCHGNRVLAPDGAFGARADVQDPAAPGQAYGAEAHALVVLTCRFDRAFWKYRKVERTYAVAMMDAGHLSQTLYLLATEMAARQLRGRRRSISSAPPASWRSMSPTRLPIAIVGCGPPDHESPHAVLHEPGRSGSTPAIGPAPRRPPRRSGGGVHDGLDPGERIPGRSGASFQSSRKRLP